MNNLSHTRSSFLFFLGISLYTSIIVYFALLQLCYTSFFTDLGAQQYKIIIDQHSPRACILDRHGHYLACNKECISAFITPTRLRKKTELFSFLEHNFPHILAYIQQHKGSSFVYLKRRLSEQDVALFSSAQLPDIHFLQETSRFYPLPTAAPLIGFTDIDNVGQAGIESSYNNQLTGSATTVCLEKDARSGYFYFHKELHHQGKKSAPVQLTIDSDLQFLVDQMLLDALEQYQAKECAALIMNPTSGEILAMSCVPSSLPSDTYFSLKDTKQKIVTESYELGSVIKIAAAIAALEEGVVTPDELIDCKNSTSCTIDGRTINTLAAHGVIPFADVIAFSNNIGIAQVAKRLNEKLYDHYINMGFGSKTGIPLPAESKGFVNHPSNWSKQSIISLSYGYEIRATLLQLGCLFCMIANEGKKVKPLLIMNNQQIPQQETLSCYSPSTMQAIKKMLQKATEHGTGFRTKIKGYTIMTKTGTANMIEHGSYRKSNDLLSCAGIIEKNDYKRIIITFVKEPSIANAYAATVPVPLFRRIAEQMVIHERII